MTDPVVELRIPASGSYVVLARTTAAAVASRLDFTLDRLEDLKLAVDEAIASLLPLADPGSEIRCAFESREATLVATITASSAKNQAPEQSGFAWTVLTALVDAVDASASDGEVSITLTAAGGTPS